MIRVAFLAVCACVVALAVYGVLTLYDETLQVGRMWETPAVKPHEAPIAAMDTTTVPFSGGQALYRVSDPDSLRPPFDLGAENAIAQGEQGYHYYCLHCHGKAFDGQGTVGQSFAPLPGDLKSARVQQFSAGRLFHEISFGVPGGRQPALASTISEDERWRIVGYVKSLGVRP